MSRSDTLRASTTYLRTNDRVRLSDLLHLLLIPSDNAAARALARLSPLGYDGFIARMNQKADDLGLDHTAYTDPSGLYADNISSAYDMARLISFASEDDRIGPIMRTPEYSFRTIPAPSGLRGSLRSATPIRFSATATWTCSAARPASSARPATAWRRC